MANIRKTQLLIAGIAVLIAAVLALSYFLSVPGQQGTSEQGAQGGTAEELGENVLTIAGKILEVNTAGDFLVFEEQRTKERFRVVAGESTSFVRLAAPANVKEGASFTFEKEVIGIGDLEADRQAFISSSHPVQSGKDIINPIEVKMLP